MSFALAPLPNPDLDLDAFARVASSAVFSDICDKLGLRRQTAEPGLNRLAGSGTLIGWARTALSMPVEAAPAEPYGREIAFVDSLRKDDVPVLVCPEPVAVWGELFSAAAKGRGARGAVLDGLVRDRKGIDALGDFPVFARGSRPTDSLGRIGIAEADITVSVCGVPVRSGDLVVADRDGVTIVPREQAAEVIRLAVEKASIESKARDLLLQGGYLRDVWDRFRVL